MNKNILTALKVILLFIFGGAILYFVYANQQKAYLLECTCKGIPTEDCSLFGKIINDFRTANFFWIFMISVAYFMSNWSRALRWKMLLEPLGYNVHTFNSFFTIMTGNLMNLALARAGEVTRPVSLSRYEKIPFEKVMGTIIVDRTVDILMLLLLVIITILFQFQQVWGFVFGKPKPPIECVVPMPPATPSVIPWTSIFLIVGIIGCLVTLVLYLKRDAFRHLALYEKVRAMILSFWEGIKSIKKVKSKPLFIFHTFLIWIMYYITVYFAFLSFAPTQHLGWQEALLAFMLGTFGILVPSPGGMGTYQVAVTAALVIHGIAKSDAFSLSNIVFFSIHFNNVFFGFLGYLLLPIFNYQKKKVVP